MGKKALSRRKNWQTESGPGGLAGTAEKNLYAVFKKHSKELCTKFLIIRQI